MEEPGPKINHVMGLPNLGNNTFEEIRSLVGHSTHQQSSVGPSLYGQPRETKIMVHNPLFSSLSLPFLSFFYLFSPFHPSLPLPTPLSYIFYISPPFLNPEFLIIIMCHTLIIIGVSKMMS